MTRLVFDAAHRREAIAGPIADAASYAVMIDGYARAKRPADAAATLDSMQAAGFDAGRIAYSSLMKAHVEAGDLQAAEACLSDLEHAADGVLAETKTLLKAERLHKNTTRYEALKRRRRALHQRIAPDTACWNTLIRGYAKTLQWKKAWGTLAQMREAGVAPDLLSYTNAATACLKADRPREALERIDELKSVHANHPRGSRKAQRLRPNIVAYTIAVLAHAKLGDLPGAQATMHEMRANGVAPNARTWAALLECCLSAGEPQAAVKIVKEMRSAGIEEDVVTLTLLLRCHFAAGDKAAAAALLRGMERSTLGTGGVAPNLVTYNAAIAGFSHLGDQKAALAALDAAAQRFAPNRETWAVLADAGTKQNSATFLHDALTCLMSRNKAVGSQAYEAWLLAAMRENRIEDAERFAHARSSGTLRILFSGDARKRALDDGTRLDAPARFFEELECTVLGTLKDSEGVIRLQNPKSTVLGTRLGLAKRLTC